MISRLQQKQTNRGNMNEQITDQQKRVIKLQAAAGLYKTLRAELEGIAYCWSETSILLSSADFDALIPPGTEIEQHLYTGDLHETAVLDGVKFTTIQISNNARTTRIKS